MDFLSGFIAVIILIIVLGAIMGWVSIFKYRDLSNKINLLQKHIAKLQEDSLATDSKMEAEPSAPEPWADETNEIAEISTELPADSVEPSQEEPVENVPKWQSQKLAKQIKPGLFTSVQDNWMIWLGGICVGLAGIFLVKYSIDAGLLGPKQRIILACIFGILLHGLAEWLRRRTGESHPAFAALAGGASIVLYAAMLAALYLYELLSPGVVFTILAIVSLLTMLLALRYGPILAILGILGAYLVPMLVSSDSGNILTALVYSLIITGSALMLMRYVYRPWLWYGMLAGALGWWLISCTTSQADGYRVVYLAALTYMILAAPVFDWVLCRIPQDDDPGTEWYSLASFHSKWKYQPLQLGLALIILCQAWSIAIESFSSSALFFWSPFVIVLLVGCRTRDSLRFLPWIALALQWIALFYCALDINNFNLSLSQIRLIGLEQEDQQYFLLFIAVMIALYSGITWWNSRLQPFSHTCSSLVNMAPVIWLALSYLLVTDFSSNWRWSLGGFALSGLYLSVTTIRLERGIRTAGVVWMILAGHFALSLAMAMYFREANLTLALSSQLISLSLLHKRFDVPGLEWLLKIVLGMVVIRLTINPWLLQYPSDIHWSLWTYGGTTLCCAVASWVSRDKIQLRKWLEAATLHLFVLFLAAETRYWLYDGDIFLYEYSLIEASINTALWSMLGLLYYYRSQFSSQFESLYVICSKILLAFSLLNYGIVLTSLNPIWGMEPVSATPIWNILLLAYGFPVVAAWLVYRYYDEEFKKVAIFITSAGLLIFVSLQIRHLWNGALDIDLPFKDAELYTYSIVWLAISVLTILVAASRNEQLFYRAGMALLIVVIGKIFIIDMADLEGLLRVASFMGLGLSLLGMAYLHQKIAANKRFPADGSTHHIENAGRSDKIEKRSTIFGVSPGFFILLVLFGGVILTFNSNFSLIALKKSLFSSMEPQSDKVIVRKSETSDCYGYYKKKQFQQAFESCLEEANQGKAHAQYNLAQLYRTGQAGIQDKRKAVEYYKLAAEQDYAEAQFSLGIMHFQGSGTDIDMEKARYWWTRSETNGIASHRVKDALQRIP